MKRSPLLALLTIAACLPAHAIDRNVAGQKIEITVVDRTTGGPKTGDAGNLTAYVAIDGGAVTALADTGASEKSSTNAPGVYQFDLSAAETNGKDLTFSGKSSTADTDVVPRYVTTTPPSFSAAILSTFDPLSDVVTVGTNLDKSGYFLGYTVAGPSDLWTYAGGRTISGIDGVTLPATVPGLTDIRNDLERTGGIAHTTQGYASSAASNSGTSSSNTNTLVSRVTEQRAANLDNLDDPVSEAIAAAQAGTADIPVNQVTVPPSRTWVLTSKGTALVGEIPLKCYLGEPTLWAIDFRHDLPTNGTLANITDVEIVSALDADGETIVDGLTFSTDEASTFGVDKTQGKLQITTVTAGTYVLEVTVSYSPSVGGGTRKGRVTLIVVE
jgi:hypothetical protein